MDRGSPSPSQQRPPWFETRGSSPSGARGPSAVNVISITRRPEGGIVNIEVRRQESGSPTTVTNLGTDRASLFGSRESSPRSMMFAGTPPLPMHESRHPLETRLRGFGTIALHHPEGSRIHRALADHVRALHGQSLFERFNEPAPPVIDTHTAHSSTQGSTGRRVHTIPIRIEGRNRPTGTSQSVERVYEIPVSVLSPSSDMAHSAPAQMTTEKSTTVRVESPSPTQSPRIRVFPMMRPHVDTSSEAERKLASLVSQLETEMGAGAAGSPTLRKQFGEVAVSSAKSPPPYHGPHITDMFGRPSSLSLLRESSASSADEGKGFGSSSSVSSPLVVSSLEVADVRSRPKPGESVVVQRDSSGNIESYGRCKSCREDICSASEACQAMGQLYHTNCFFCSVCRKTLRGKAFYEVQGRIYCEDDYARSGFQQLAIMCDSCGLLIVDQAVQALGKSYHRTCFRCKSCNQCLDSSPFTIDSNKQILCLADYYRLHSTKCSLCGQYIVPVEGSDDAIRVVMLDNEYCVNCFRCTDCGRQLSDRADELCYPLLGILLCHNCHVRRAGGDGRSMSQAIA